MSFLADLETSKPWATRSQHLSCHIVAVTCATHMYCVRYLLRQSRQQTPILNLVASTARRAVVSLYVHLLLAHIYYFMGTSSFSLSLSFFVSAHRFSYLLAWDMYNLKAHMEASGWMVVLAL